MLLKAQGGMLCPPWVETGPFEPCGLYRLIVQLWLRPSAVMSQHSRQQINDLVLEQMSSVVKAVCDSGTKGTNIAVYKAVHNHSCHLCYLTKIIKLRCDGL